MNCVSLQMIQPNDKTLGFFQMGMYNVLSYRRLKLWDYDIGVAIDSNNRLIRYSMSKDQSRLDTV